MSKYIKPANLNLAGFNNHFIINMFLLAVIVLTEQFVAADNFSSENFEKSGSLNILSSMAFVWSFLAAFFAALTAFAFSLLASFPLVDRFALG